MHRICNLPAALAALQFASGKHRLWLAAQRAYSLCSDTVALVPRARAAPEVASTQPERGRHPPYPTSPALFISRECKHVQLLEMRQPRSADAALVHSQAVTCATACWQQWVANGTTRQRRCGASSHGKKAT